ncbi:hypothetical protein D3C86_1338890 [compost metagenome]
MTTQTTEGRYEEGLKRYEEGAPLEEVLAHFQALYKDTPNDVRVIVSLSWLHILLGNKAEALAFSKAAKGTAQGRYNHALALLTFKEKGVREKLDEAIRMGGHEGMHDAMANLEDAIQRKGGDFPAAQKLLAWIKEMH